MIRHLLPSLPRLQLFAAAGVLLCGCSTQPPAVVASTVPAPTVPAAAVPATSATVPAAPPSCPPPVACPACPVCPPPATAPPPAPPLQSAQWHELPGWADDDHAKAWPALRESCKAIGKQPRWKAVCDATVALGETPSAASLREFFETRFRPWSVANPDGSRDGLVTGYYEPLIKGSRQRSDRYPWPVHGVPPDLLTVDFGDLHPDLRHLRLRGRLVGNKVVPYWTRAEIERQADKPAAQPLLWAADPIELFFLQVQGSGRVQLPDGSHVRIGYADQNGHPYQSIGRWLVDRGELPLEKASMEGIKNWAQTHPARLSELLNANPSYVFFKELPASPNGPNGALGVPLTATRSIAVDPRTIPLGAPVFLATTWPLSERPLRRLMFAQDTGGAIKGAVRADFFWGFGPEAGAEAGRMRQQGQMWVLLPNDVQP